MWQEVQDKNHWDGLVQKEKHSRFLQSWQWGEFQASLGRKVLRLSWNNEVFAQAIKMNLPGKFAYWYVPHGPSTAAPEAWDELIKILGEHGAIFLRVDPIVDLDSNNYKPKIVPSTQPQCSLVLDLGLPAEQLLAGMHQKTRYNINLAEKKGVVIKEGAVDIFLQLNKQTTSRDNFVSHHDAYYKQMVSFLNPLLSEEGEGGGAMVKVWQAEFNGKALASAMVMYFGDTATYLHGASSNEDRNLMAPYLLHWEIIKGAQKQGFKFYDWWGVNPGNEKHPVYKKSWEGITRFKTGFGGEFVSNPPSFDLIYRPVWYRLYRLFRNINAILKSY